MNFTWDGLEEISIRTFIALEVNYKLRLLNCLSHFLLRDHFISGKVFLKLSSVKGLLEENGICSFSNARTKFWRYLLAFLWFSFLSYGSVMVMIKVPILWFSFPWKLWKSPDLPQFESQRPVPIAKIHNAVDYFFPNTSGTWCKRNISPWTWVSTADTFAQQHSQTKFKQMFELSQNQKYHIQL